MKDKIWDNFCNHYALQHHRGRNDDFYEGATIMLEYLMEKFDLDENKAILQALSGE